MDGFDRRTFLTRTGLGTGALILGGVPLGAGAANRRSAIPFATGGKFPEGVMSGEPATNSATLWTRLSGLKADRRITLEVARDPDFRRVVARRAIATSGRRGHSVKARIEGLRPHERYWYRFETRDEQSPVGRFQTAPPPDSREPVRFAFFSCAEYTHGFYNAYDIMRDDDLDFVVCLGDYVYAEAYHSRAGGTGVRDDRVGREPAPTNGSIEHEAVTLDDYRAKYALYRSDRTLRALHARFPIVATWDDHEIQNNYAGAAPGGGLGADKRFSARRRRAATKAYFEAMPFFAPRADRVYRGQRHGRTVDLIMLDQRQYRADQPCDDAVAAPCANWNAPRPFLGRRQMAWLKRRLSRSRATWKVISADMPIGLMVPDGKDAEGRNMFEAVANGDGPALGREIEIADLLSAIKRAGIRNVVWVTADVHYTAAHRYDPERARFRDFAPFWEFVSGPLHAGGFGPNAPDDTFGLEVVWQRAPDGRRNVPPTEGGQFFGEAAIEGRSGVLTVVLKDMAGTTLWHRSFEPERG
jgi:alkaline phosphatase D